MSAYTPEEDTIVLNMVSCGASNEAIGRVIGRSHRSVAKRLCLIRPVGLRRKSLPTAYSPEQDELIVALRNAGVTFREIGERIGRTEPQTRDRHRWLLNGSNKANERDREAAEPNHDGHVERCIAAGGFIRREVIRGLVVTFDWMGRPIAGSAAA